MEKKAQISIFIIIGIILVIVTSFFIYNSDFEFFVSHDTKLKNQVSTIVKDCIYKSANTGTFILGQQGGYISIPSEIANNPTKYILVGSKIPNWDVQNGNIPTIDSMQQELTNYVQEQSFSCIEHNVKDLENVFDIKLGDKFEVISTINDNNIVIEATYPITFNEKNSEEILNVEDYTVTLKDLRLGDLYSLAVSVYNTQAEERVFESLTLEQIRTSNDYSSSLSVPTEGMMFSCGKRVWTYPQLKSNIANLNNRNFKYLQFEGTSSKGELLRMNLNATGKYEAYKPYYDNLYRVDLDNVKPTYQNFDVNVMMPVARSTDRRSIFFKYPFRTFEVTPSDGQIVQSMDMDVDVGTKIPIPCIQLFHHLYDLDYDLVVQLKDKTIDNDIQNNFVFQFPVRVQIKNNEPKKANIPKILTEEPTVNKNSYCNNDSYQYPLMVLTTDNNDNPISDVNVKYQCVNLKCDMGITKKKQTIGGGGKPELITDYPYCIGGQVIGEKEGYHKESVRVDTDSSLLNRETFVGNNLVELKLTPLKSFNINSPENFLIVQKETGQGLRVYDENDGAVLVQIENRGRNFESTAIWPNDGEFLNKLEFLDEENVDYNLSVYYMNKDNDLRGMLEMQNWTPQIHSGNKIQFIVPGTQNTISEDDYINFYEYVLEESVKRQPRFY